MRGHASIKAVLAALGAAAFLVAVPGSASASVGEFAMAVQPDGRILLAGGSGRIGGAVSGKEFGAVVRYERDGGLDRSFGGGDGVALIRQMQPFTALALQPDGRIVLTAELGGGGGVARLLPDGHLDGNFGFGGIIAPGASSAWFPTSVGIGGDGAIYVGGMTGYPEDPGEHWYGSLYRVDPGGLSGDWVGSMTNREGAPGEPKTYLKDFVFGPNGTVVGAGWLAVRQPGARSQVVLARMLPATTTLGLATGPDPSFGGGAGLVTPNFVPSSPASETANALSRDRRKRLLIAGQADGRLLLARYSPGGILDRRFGSSGAFITSGGRSGEAEANAVAVQARGGIFAAGSSAYACGGERCEGLLLTRHKGNGRLDRGFGHAGVVSPRIKAKVYGTPASEVAYGVAARPEDKVLVAGLLTNPGSSRFFLRRYLGDGSPDPSFGDRGRLTTLPLVAGTPAPGSGR
jgi:uncharacterized delta-60 repeat protein